MKNHENDTDLMKRIRVTSGGQISIPAEVRRRWATDELVFEDLGDRVVVRPMPDDPVTSAKGSLSGRQRMSSTEARARARREEAASLARKDRE